MKNRIEFTDVMNIFNWIKCIKIVKKEWIQNWDEIFESDTRLDSQLYFLRVRLELCRSLFYFDVSCAVCFHCLLYFEPKLYGSNIWTAVWKFLSLYFCMKARLSVGLWSLFTHKRVSRFRQNLLIYYKHAWNGYSLETFVRILVGWRMFSNVLWSGFGIYFRFSLEN